MSGNRNTLQAMFLVATAVATVSSTASAQQRVSGGGHTPAPHGPSHPPTVSRPLTPTHAQTPHPSVINRPATPAHHVVPVPAPKPTPAPAPKPAPAIKPTMRDLMPFKTTPKGVPIPSTTPPSLRPHTPIDTTPAPSTRYVVPDPDAQKLHFGTPVGKGRVDGNVHPQGGEVNVTLPVGK